MSVTSVLDVLNGAFDACLALIGANYLLGEKVVLGLSLVVSSIASLVSTALLVIRVLLEDLVLCLSEGVEAVVGVVTWVGKGLQAGGQGVIRGVEGVKYGCATLAAAVEYSYGAVAKSASSFLNLLGASVLLLLNLVPRSLYLLYSGAITIIVRTITSTKNAAVSLSREVVSAPLEVFIGLLAVTALGYGSIKLARRLSLDVRLRDASERLREHLRDGVAQVRQADLRPATVLRTLLGAALFVYVNFIRGVFVFSTVLLRVVLESLASVHAPRFHHVGDSDVEDEEDNSGLVGHVDDSDNDQGPSSQSVNPVRRNYDLLLQRRQQRLNTPKKKKKKRKPTGQGGDHSESSSEDVEEMLFEQVEREREDKLCVICQDKEKCVMMLPCRHLCVCMGCQGQLQKQRVQRRLQYGSCPICRKEVKQTIKAYL